MLHLPLLRHGEVYRSLETAPVPDVRRGVVAAEVSVANVAMLRRDAKRARAARDLLRLMPAAERVRRSQAAADLLLSETLPCGEASQTPDAYVQQTSDTTGLPHALVRRNLDKIVWVLRHLDVVLAGLMRGIPLSALDDGEAGVGGLRVGLVQQAHTLAAVLPSNSPGVHSLWVPALALGAPLVLKPGKADPWTPLRLAAAFAAAGLPAEAVGYYPAGHEASAALVDLHDRTLLFGGDDVVRRFGGNPRVEVHGPGFSKIVVGADRAGDELILDPIVASVADNGGRSCINASTILCPPGTGDRIARALAERLVGLRPSALEDPDAKLAAFAEPDVARAIDARIDSLLAGATDVTAAMRGGPRCVEHDGLVWLLPTVVRCGLAHPLARTEFPFPFVSVVEVPASETVEALGPTLALLALTDDDVLRAALRDARHVDRLHLTDTPTSRIAWDQPHEGNLFEALWRRRAVG